jgi:large subunit ribosomal protein L24
MRVLKYRKRDRARAVNRKRHEDNAERVKLRVTKGDTVRVMRGDDKGKARSSGCTRRPGA